MSMRPGKRTRRALAIASAAVAVLTVVGPAKAQVLPLEVPFVEEWASSPHARLTEAPFRYWDEEGEIPATCARCHSTPGFRDYIGADGSTPWVVERAAPVGSVISCVACHNNVTRTLDFVVFPSGLKVEKLGPQARCMTCHQGRESTISVNKSIEGIAEDAVSDKLAFINIHYRAAGATRFGTLAKGGYEYAGKTYKGLFEHDKDANQCVQCHNSHTTRQSIAECALCHREVKAKKDFRTVRRSKDDFDGNGDVKEGIFKEVEALHTRLLAAIQAYAKTIGNKAVAYDPKTYPYFFNDTNENGKADSDEVKFPNRYAAWTPRLLKAAYNYQFVAKDPGAYVHNPPYIIQLLHDSLADLSAKVAIDMSRTIRPQP